MQIFFKVCVKPFIELIFFVNFSASCLGAPIRRASVGRAFPRRGTWLTCSCSPSSERRTILRSFTLSLCTLSPRTSDTSDLRLWTRGICVECRKWSGGEFGVGTDISRFNRVFVCCVLAAAGRRRRQSFSAQHRWMLFKIDKICGKVWHFISRADI